MVRAPDAVEAARAAVGQKPFGAFGGALADADGNEVDLVPGGRLSKGAETADWRVLFGAMTFYHELRHHRGEAAGDASEPCGGWQGWALTAASTGADVLGLDAFAPKRES